MTDAFGQEETREDEDFLNSPLTILKQELDYIVLMYYTGEYLEENIELDINKLSKGDLKKRIISVEIMLRRYRDIVNKVINIVGDGFSPNHNVTYSSLALNFLINQDVFRLGIGDVICRDLAKCRIKTIGDLCKHSENSLRNIFVSNDVSGLDKKIDKIKKTLSLLHLYFIG